MRILLIFLVFILFSCSSNENPVSTNDSIIKSNPLYLFVGSYTEDLGWVNGKGAGVTVLECDRNTGELQQLAHAKHQENPSYLLYDKQTSKLYSANENEEGSISEYSFNRMTNTLSHNTSSATAGASTCHLSMDKSSSYIYTANYSSGSISIHAYKDSLTNLALDTITHTGSGPFAKRQEAAHLHMISSSPSDNLMHGVDLGTDRLYHYETTDGTLELAAMTQLKAGTGARHIVFHPSNGKAYLSYEFTNEVQVLDTRKMPFEVKEVVRGFDTVIEKHSVTSSAIRIHPNGQFLYMANRANAENTKNSISVYAVHKESGSISLAQNIVIKAAVPRDFNIDPSGQFMFVGGQNSDELIRLEIDQSNGRLSDSGYSFKIATPTSLVFSE